MSWPAFLGKESTTSEKEVNFSGAKSQRSQYGFSIVKKQRLIKVNLIWKKAARSGAVAEWQLHRQYCECGKITISIYYIIYIL